MIIYRINIEIKGMIQNWYKILNTCENWPQILLFHALHSLNNDESFHQYNWNVGMKKKQKTWNLKNETMGQDGFVSHISAGPEYYQTAIEENISTSGDFLKNGIINID